MKFSIIIPLNTVSSNSSNFKHRQVHTKKKYIALKPNTKKNALIHLKIPMRNHTCGIIIKKGTAEVTKSELTDHYIKIKSDSKEPNSYNLLVYSKVKRAKYVKKFFF